jgi:NADH dehydrogenase
VYVGDVARALHFALEEPEARGRRYDLCGPRVYTLQQLVQAVCAITGRRRLITGMPDALSYFQAWMLEHLPGKLMTRDNLRSMSVDNVCSGRMPGAICPLEPASVEAVIPEYMGPQSIGERYARYRAGR